MTYFYNKEGTIQPYPHKKRIVLETKLKEMLGRYSLHEVLSEIGHLRPSFHIQSTPAPAAVTGTAPPLPLVTEAAVTVPITVPESAAVTGSAEIGGQPTNVTPVIDLARPDKAARQNKSNRAD